MSTSERVYCDHAPLYFQAETTMDNDQPYDRWLDPCDNRYFYEQFTANCLDNDLLTAANKSRDEKCRVIYEGFDRIERITGIRCQSLLHAIKLLRNYIKTNYGVNTNKCDFQGITTPGNIKSTSPTQSTGRPSPPPTTDTSTLPKTPSTKKQTTDRTSPSPTRRTTTFSYSTTTALSENTDSKIPSALGSRDVDPAVVGGIVGGIVGFVVVVFLVFLFFLYIWKRKNTNNGHTQNTPHRSNIKETRYVVQPNYGHTIPHDVIKQTGRYSDLDQVITGGHQQYRPGDTVKENSPQNHSYVNVGHTVESVDVTDDDTEDIYMEISEVGYDTLQAACIQRQDQYGTDYLEPKPVYCTTSSGEQYMNFNGSGIQSNVSNLENKNVYIELISDPHYESKTS